MTITSNAQRDYETQIPHTSLAEAGAALSARPYARRGVSVPHRTIRVVVADDQRILRLALRSLLESAAPEVSVVGEAASGREAVEMAGRLSPDIILMDLDMAGGDGLTATKVLADRGDPAKVLVLSMHSEQEQLLPSLRAGARGYLAKDVAVRELVDAIRVVAAGDVYVQPAVARLLAGSVSPKNDVLESASDRLTTLSERERTVFRLVAEGFNGPEIGAQLGIAAKTIDTYKQRIEDKLGLTHRTEYVRLALDAQLLG